MRSQLKSTNRKVLCNQGSSLLHNPFGPLENTFRNEGLRSRGEIDTHFSRASQNHGLETWASEWPRKRPREAHFELYDPGERVLWEQRGHDLKKSNAHFSSRRGEKVPVQEGSRG